MRSLTSLAAAGALSLALLTAGCTSAQELEVAKDIDAACILLPIGTSIAATIASSAVGAGAAAATVSAVVNTAVSTVCATLTTRVQAAIEAINADGATATVTVTTTPPKSSALRGSASAKAAVLTFIVPPAPF